MVCLCLKAYRICNAAVVSGRCYYLEGGEEKKFARIFLNKSSKEIDFKSFAVKNNELYFC